MSGANVIAILSLTVASSAVVAVAHQQGWDGSRDGPLAALSSSCRPPVQSSAWAHGAGSQSMAETRALVGWSKRAKRHGNRFSSWHNARSRDVSCKSMGHHTAKCIVKGRPCQRQAELDYDVSF